MTVFSLLILYCAFRLKHFVCDFMLQTSWMALEKGKPGTQAYKALFAHAAVHGAGTLAIMLVFAPGLWWLGLVDVFVHAGIDRIKAQLSEFRGWTPRDGAFWKAIGADQEAHNFTHLVYIVIIVARAGGVIAG